MATDTLRARFVAAARREYERRQQLGRQKQACEQSLLEFVRTFWRVLEPETPLVEGWPLEQLCRLLTAITDGQMTRVIINVPPGFMKSLMLNVFWPAWEWGPRNMPHLRYISASYSSSLTERDNGRLARLVTDSVYVRMWGDRVELSKDGVGKLETTKTGWKLATSVGGTTTGERGDRVLIDDANNPANVESETVRGTTNQWLREVMPDRLNDIRKGVIICLQQRTHEEDATGTLVRYGTNYLWWVVVMEFDPQRTQSLAIRWDEDGDATEWLDDPREEEGDLAWPERFPPDEVEKLKTIKGEYGWAGQYQQSPGIRGGGIIKSHWWMPWPPVGEEDVWLRERVLDDGRKVMRPIWPEFDLVIGSVDGAFTEDEGNDWCAMSVWGTFTDKLNRPRVMLVSAWRERLEIHPFVLRIISTCRLRHVDRLLIENKASGRSAAQEVRRLMREEEWTIELIEPKGDKVARLLAVQPLFQGGVVHAPYIEPAGYTWVNAMIDEVAAMPNAAHDDLTDTCSQALNWLRKHGFARLASEAEVELHDQLLFRGNNPTVADLYGV